MKTCFRSVAPLAVLFLAPLIVSAVEVAPAPSPTPAPLRFGPDPVERARLEKIAREDRRKMMERLGLTEPTNLPPDDSDPNRPPDAARKPGEPNWSDPQGHFIARSPWGNWTNYDLAKADRYPLPEVLRLKNGSSVRDRETWEKKRRPEILEAFQTEIYGHVPEHTPAIQWEVLESDPKALGGTAKMKRIVGQIDHSAYPSATPSIALTLYTPANATGPVPVMVVIDGLAAFPPEVRAFFAKRFGDPNQVRTLLLAHGWGYATFDPGAVQADNGAGLATGIIGLVNQGKAREPEQWGAIAAWVWGLSRAIDYFETDHDVDAKRLGVEGHSRYGKTALVAAAFEPRWAIAYASCSGEGGAKLHRHDFGESVDIVASPGEYHWMAGNFLKYGGHWDALPVDAHELIALVAPRPILVTGGTEDLWPDPVGEFKACVAAGPVYRLLGKKDLGTDKMPAPDADLTAGDLAFRFHTGGHTDLPDWPAFIRFADRYFQPDRAGAIHPLRDLYLTAR